MLYFTIKSIGDVFGCVSRLQGKMFHGRMALYRYTVLLIYDGSSWRDVRVLEAAVTELRGVTTLSAAADLDIGDYSLK